MNSTKKIIALPLLLVFFFNLARAQVFVKLDAHGANNGTSWIDAYTNLDSAIQKTSSGQIWVAAGTYKPSLMATNFNFPTFTIAKNISLFGGFSGNEFSLNQRNIANNPTILSGDVGIVGDSTDNTPRVITITGTNIDSTCILDGFTVVRACYRNYAGFDYDNAAIYISTGNQNSTPVIRNCTIRDNFGTYGAGIYVTNSQALIINNFITNNVAYEGAGIYLDYAGNAKIVSNRITNNKCVGGFTHLSGGGIQIQAYCAPYIYGNLIDNNMVGHYGGGICIESNYSATITNNIISNNRSNTGGGIYIDFTATDIINNLIMSNKATNGGGLYVDYSSSSRSINNTIVDNLADYGAAAYLKDGNMQITNTIMYSNASKYSTIFVSNNPNRTDWFPKIDYCDIENGKQGISISDMSKIDSVWRVGNISTIPDFLDTINSNYRLRPTSHCIDSGKIDTTDLKLPTRDVGGATRLIGARVDIGCYEYDSLFMDADSLTVSPGTINLEGRGDSTFYLTIRSNATWFVSSKPDWINIGSTVGGNPTMMQVTAFANPSLSSSRNDKIILSRPGIAPPVQIKINQSGYAFLNVAPDTLYINSLQNDSAAFNIQSNILWYLSGFPGWATFNEYYSSNNATISAFATANPSGVTRTSQVFVYSNNSSIYPPFIRKVILIQFSSAKILCQNGTDSLSAGASAAGYQWQVDTGSGFVNLSDDAHYIGAINKWLKLINIPSAFYGYKYRCVTGSGNANVYTLKIQNNWTGAASNQWENPLNWSCGVLPDLNTDVSINYGNVFVNVDTTVRSLTIGSGASVTVAPGVRLTILK